MEFVYIGIDQNSVRQKGKIEANSDSEVIDFLRAGKITPISVRKAESLDFFSRKRVKDSDIAVFTRQLSSMILTGLTLVESLKVLEKQTNPKVAKLSTELIAQLSEGASFSEALSQHKDSFSEVYIALISAAEKGGLLDKILVRLADDLEKGEDIKRKIKGALFYPAIVVGFMVIVIAVMNIFVIPQFSSLFESMKVDIPFSTKVILGMSRLFTTFYPVLIIIGVGFIFLYKRLGTTENGKKVIDEIKLKLVVFGDITKLSILNQTSRTLSLLISSGASILESLNITAKVADNYEYKNAFLTASSMVERGVPLSEALDHSKVFPPMFVQMAKVGESTGKIDESLYKASEYFERDLDAKIRNLTTAIEPIIILVLGVSIAFLIFSIITPIYSLISEIG